MFSVTVIGRTSMKCWWTMPMPSAMASRGARISRTLTVDEDVAAVGRVEAVGDAHRRRLAGAVFADDRVDSAGGDGDVEVIVRQHGAEALRDAAQLEFHCAIASVTLISPAMIFFAGFFRGGNRVRGDEVAVELVDDVADAVALEAEDVEPALELPVDDFLDDVVDRVVDALDHAGQDEAGLHHVLVRIDADDEMRRASVLGAGLLDRVEGAKPGIARGSEDHVGALVHLRQRQLLAFAGVIPRRVGDADVILDDLDCSDSPPSRPPRIPSRSGG